MTKIAFVFALVVSVLVCLLPAAPAQAAAARTFVSAAGSDANNCANVATPCRHFAAAYAATAPNGEIFVLDPANYGSLTITGPVSIEGHDWASVAPPTDGNAITINANPGDSINIRGVSLNGTGITGNTNGIVFNSGGSLTVTDCVVQNFTTTNIGDPTKGNGILLQPTAGTINFSIVNTIVRNNGYVGISYLLLSGTAAANGAIDRAVVTNNKYGIAIETPVGSGSTAVAISNSIADSNSLSGIEIISGSAALAVSIDNTSSSGNGAGIQASNSPNVYLGRSVITANSGDGITNATGANTFYTYQDNRINGNGTDISSPLNSLALH